ncbi:MAG: hypothetical protein M3Y86_01350, partial [Verrucomicrobiota bacterium]|nr:hypothetical protein [Verrucomicrobiota bacterium]
MDETGTHSGSRWRSWLKWVGISLGALVLLLVVFHRPILQTVVRKVAVHFAAGQNLKLDLRVEGSILGGIVLRNVHATATGPSTLQSADVDLLRVHYSLWGYLRGGMAALLQDVELRNATVLLNPAKAPPTIEPKKNQKFSLPAFFPDRLVLSDVNVRMVSQPQDLILEHLFLELLPNKPGQLRIAKLQLASGKSWTDVTAQTTYENRNLYLRNLVLDEQTQLASVNIDASQIGQNKLAVGLHGKVAGGQIDTTLSLGGKGGSVESKIDLSVRDTSLDAVRRYFQPAGSTAQNDVVKKTAEIATKTVGAAATTVTGNKQSAETAAKAGESLPTGMSGDVRQLTIKGSGTADQPRSWQGTIEGQVDNLAAAGVSFDHANIDVKAANGQAQINNVELSRGANKITLSGTAALPDTFAGFGHSPANIQLHGQISNLGEITAGLPQPITGNAEVHGQIKVANDTVRADVALAGGPIDFGQGTVEKFVMKVNAARVMPPPDEQRPYYDGLTAKIDADLTAVRAKEYALDSVHAEIEASGRDVTIAQLLVRRRENELALHGTYELPQDFSRAAAQPAAITFSLTAPNVADFWVADAPVSGHL